MQHLSVWFGGDSELGPFKRAWVLLQVGDLLSTLYIFHLGGYEANPLVSGLMPVTGTVGGIFAMKFIGCAIVIPLRSRRIILAGLAITSAILAWNLGLVTK